MNETNTQVQTFKPEDIASKVRERIQTSFVDLIPQEHWDALVKSAIDDFARERPASYQYNRERGLPDGTPQPSKLKVMVEQEVEKMFREAMLKEFAKPEWLLRWTPTGEQGSALATEVARQLAPDMVGAFFGGMVQNLVVQVRNALQNQTRQY